MVSWMTQNDENLSNSFYAYTFSFISEPHDLHCLYWPAGTVISGQVEDNKVFGC